MKTARATSSTGHGDSPPPLASRDPTAAVAAARSQGAGRLLDLGIVLLCVAAFLVVALPQLHLPGLYYDEAADAVPALRLLQGRPQEPLRGAVLHLGPLTLPIMVFEYVGMVNTYLLLPFLALLGSNAVAIRLMTVLAGALTVALTYFVGKAVVGRPVGAGAALLLALNPSFVFFTRQGIHVTSIMTALAMGALLCLLKWRSSGRAPLLWAAAFLLGLGVSAKLLFIWYVLALAAAALVMAALRRNLHLNRATLTRSPPASIGAAFVLFLAGAWMILLYNLQTGGTLEVLGNNLITTTQGVSNLAFGQNLLTQLDAFSVLLNGGFFWFLGGVYRNELYPPLFLLASAFLAGLVLLRPQARAGLLPVAFFLTMVAALVVQSAFTVSGLGPTHLLIALPFPQLLIAMALLWAPWRLPLSRVGLGLGVLLFAGLALLDLRVDLDYHRALAASGGLGMHSDASYRLTAYLKQTGGPSPVAMDWGIRNEVEVVSEGRVVPQEVFGYEAKAGEFFRSQLAPRLEDPASLYIFLSPRWRVFDRWEGFVAEASKRGKVPVEAAVFAQRDGEPVFLVYRLEALGGQ